MSIQYEMAISRPSTPSNVPPDFVSKCKEAHSAFWMALKVSGLDEKEVYMHPSIDIDAGTFSKICSGKANFPADKIRAFCDLVGNTIYPEWIAHQVGCTLVMIRSEAERRAEAAEAALAKEREKVEMLRDLLRRNA